jgi:signal peptidase I
MMMNLLARAYRLLLLTYPRDFRFAYGREMERLFQDQYRDATRRRKVGGFMMRTAADTVSTSLRERLEAARGIIRTARRSAPRGYVTEWIVTILMYLFATTTLVQAYVIPTGSMEGTLRVGDHMLVDRAAYATPGAVGRHIMPYRDVARGDIVAILYPEDTSQTFVKRVIGLPGDRIHLRDKQVIRNGHALTEPYTQHVDPGIDPYRDDFPLEPSAFTSGRGHDMFAHHVLDGEVVVPPDSLFVMGDNRDNSSDSRYWGFVPRGYVVGKPLFVYWSFDAPSDDLQHWSVHHVVDVAEHFFTRTRWNRMFLVPHSEQAQDEGPR